MKRQIAIHLAGILVLAAVGCAKPKVWVAPRVDLQRYGTLGLVEIASPLGYGPMATQQLMTTLHSAQPGVPVLELGPLPEVLLAVERTAMGPDTARAIGERYGVDVVVLGDLEIERPRPNFSIHSFAEANASAEILGTLTARFVDTRSGATIWSDQSRGKRTVAHLNVATGRLPQFGAVDPQGEHAQLIAGLVGRVTDDFRGYWARP